MYINKLQPVRNNALNFEKSLNKTFQTSEDSVDFQNQNKKIKKSKVKEFFNKIKIGLAVVGSAVLSALTVLFLENKKINKLNQEKKKLSDAINNLVLPEDFDEKLSEKIESLSVRSLNYNPIKIDKTCSSKENTDNAKTKIKMSSEREQTFNRLDATKLNYPKYNPNHPYHFEFPESGEMKITKEYEEYTPQPLTMTTVSEAYSDSLNWDNNKVARDLMQNFFDGHGQTLDGVTFDVIPTENGKHKVRISGKSIFAPSKAILLGESSKKENTKAAGCYGEGLKMVVLKLLKEKGADKVSISSDDWKVNWELAESPLADNKRVLAYDLQNSEPIDGNYIEFETDDDDFIKSIIDSFDRFYHYNNPAFKCPDFENDILGIKILDNDKEKGKFFIAGQEFEIDGKFDGLSGANIFIKERPPVTVNGKFVFDPSRDRTSLTKDSIENIGKWISEKENMSDEDYVKVLHSLQDYWESYPPFSDKRPGKVNSFLQGILDNIIWDRQNLIIDFPDKSCISDSINATQELKEQYHSAGYKICNASLKYIGMTSLERLVDETRQHKPIAPDKTEKNKILILKDALATLAPVLKEMFTEQELNPNIYIFDKTSPLESKVYKDTQAEAIVENGNSKGFWIDKSYLKSDFASVLATALHELTHKFGGDESMEFSYKLTNVLNRVLSSTTDNPNIALQLKLLEGAWNAQV